MVYRFKKDLNWCMTVMSGNEYDNYALNMKTSTTSESEDNNHPSKMAVDGMNTTWWQSRDDNEQETFTLTLLKNTTVITIAIQFKYAPDTLAISILHSHGIWEGVA